MGLAMSAPEDRYARLINNLLIAAAQDGNYHTVHTLLVEGADPRAGGNAALKEAALRGYAHLVALLLHAGADVHADNETPLLNAARSGDAATVKLLLDVGADPSMHAFKPLRDARERGYEDVARLLQPPAPTPAVAGPLDEDLAEALRKGASRESAHPDGPLDDHSDFAAAIRKLEEAQRDLESNLDALNRAVFDHFRAKGELFHQPVFDSAKRRASERNREKLREFLKADMHAPPKGPPDPKP